MIGQGHRRMRSFSHLQTYAHPFNGGEEQNRSIGYMNHHYQAMPSGVNNGYSQVPYPYQTFSNIPSSQVGNYGPLLPPYGAIQQGFLPQQSSIPFNAKPKLTETVYQNPLQQPEMTMFAPQSQSYGMYMNPYPKQSTIPKPPSGVKTFVNSFKTQEGNFDVNKMVDTAGQMMNAVTQVSSMVKGLGGIFKV